MKSDAKRTERIEIEGFGVNGGGVPVRPSPSIPRSDATWTQVSQSFTLPADFAAPSLCVHFAYPSNGQIWVDDVRLVAGDGKEASLLQDKIAVGPKTAPVGNLYFAGKPTPPALNVVNTDSRAHKVAVQALVADWEARAVFGSGGGYGRRAGRGSQRNDISARHGPAGNFPVGL